MRIHVVMASLLLAAPVVAQQKPGPAEWKGTPAAAPFLEAMTWTEVRDAIAAGKKTVIIPIGGTEQNGPHMVLGKHNFIVSFAASVMAERIGNTLIAPTIQYVPEGNYSSANFGSKPGVITNPQASYVALLDAAVRSLKVHGFTDIILIGDSGGNQSGIRAVADTLNVEWKDSGVRVFALTEYYQKGQADIRAWLLREHGYDQATVGSHAGISDTSQLMYVFSMGVRTGKLAVNGGSRDSGVNGDPTKATAEIGQKAIDLKVAAGIAQYRSMKGG
jgi:creatinine amidohydrolase/Fe(II)-dependent formamide hydrolase-like protein